VSKQPKPPRKEPEDEDARLDQGIRATLGKAGEDCSPEQIRRLREQFRLNVLYPGKYVAFRDHYEGEGDNCRLVHREVLCASRTLRGLHERLEELPQDVQRRAQVTYVEVDKAPTRRR
jgi:hypothetical protein